MPNSRVWTFTINNFTDEDVERIKSWADDDFVKAATVGEERGSSGTPHLQGFVRFKDTVTHVRAKVLIGDRSHVEPCRNPDAAAEYCRKEGNVIIDKSHVDKATGKRGMQGWRKDIQELHQALDEGGLPLAKKVCPIQLIKYPSGAKLYCSITSPSPMRPDLQVYVYIGESGIGKSAIAHCWNDPWKLSLGVRGTQPWFDGYRGQETLIIDEFEGQIPFRILLSILDIYPLTAQVKGLTCEAHWKRVIITSNLDWLDWYPEIQRKDITPLQRRIHYIGFKAPFNFIGPLPECLDGKF